MPFLGKKKVHTPSTTLEIVEQRIKDKTVVDESTGCWLFTGAKDKGGYGHIQFNYKVTSVHRISACIHLGLDIKDKTTQVNHKQTCPNRHCWNPEHLYTGSAFENAIDRSHTGNFWGPRKNFDE